MAKNVRGGSIHIRFNSSGTFQEAIISGNIGTTDDAALVKRHSKELTLTAQQITAIQNFIDNKFAELKSDEGIA